MRPFKNNIHLQLMPALGATLIPLLLSKITNSQMGMLPACLTFDFSTGIQGRIYFASSHFDDLATPGSTKAVQVQVSLHLPSAVIMDIRLLHPSDIPHVQQTNITNLPENYFCKYYMYHALSWPQLSYVAVDVGNKEVTPYRLRTVLIERAPGIQTKKDAIRRTEGSRLCSR